jgi:hypothetical protein
VCSGASGAPAGFSVQWMTAADHAANGGTWYTSDDPRLCKASFSSSGRSLSLAVGVTAAYATTLATYNEGAIGPGACGEPDPGEDF